MCTYSSVSLFTYTYLFMYLLHINKPFVRQWEKAISAWNGLYVSSAKWIRKILRNIGMCFCISGQDLSQLTYSCTRLDSEIEFGCGWYSSGVSVLRGCLTFVLHTWTLCFSRGNAECNREEIHIQGASKWGAPHVYTYWTRSFAVGTQKNAEPRR